MHLGSLSCLSKGSNCGSSSPVWSFWWECLIDARDKSSHSKMIVDSAARGIILQAATRGTVAQLQPSISWVCPLKVLCYTSACIICPPARLGPAGEQEMASYMKGLPYSPVTQTLPVMPFLITENMSEICAFSVFLCFDTHFSMSCCSGCLYLSALCVYHSSSKVLSVCSYHFPLRYHQFSPTYLIYPSIYIFSFYLQPCMLNTTAIWCPDVSAFTFDV